MILIIAGKSRTNFAPTYLIIFFFFILKTMELNQLQVVVVVFFFYIVDVYFTFTYYYYFFLPCHVAFRILVFQLGMELIPPAVEAQTPKHSWKKISSSAR